MGIARCISEYFECLKFSDGGDRVECSWVRIGGMANKAGTTMGVCYGSPNQNEEVNEAFEKQLREVSQSLALVVEEYFNLTDAYWK